MGFYGHLLEFFGCTIRMFWYALCLKRSLNPSLDICILCCIHGLARSVCLSVLHSNLRFPVHHADHSILCVKLFPTHSFEDLLLTDYSVSILPCHRRVDLKCRARESTNSAELSLNCPGTWLKILLTSRLHTGMLSDVILLYPAILTGL